MKLIRISTLLIVGLVPVLALAAGKKDFCPEPRKDPREQSHKVEGQRTQIRGLRHNQLASVLEAANIKPSEIKALLQRADPQEHKEVESLLLRLAHAEGPFRIAERAEILALLNELIGPEAQPKVNYVPSAPLGVRRAAVSDPTLTATPSVLAALQHVLDRDPDKEVRSAAWVAYKRLQEYETMTEFFIKDAPRAVSQATYWDGFSQPEKSLREIRWEMVRDNKIAPPSHEPAFTRESLRAGGKFEAFSDAEIDAYLAQDKEDHRTFNASLRTNSDVREAAEAVLQRIREAGTSSQ